VIHYPAADADAIVGDLLRDRALCFDDDEQTQLDQRLAWGFADEPDGSPLEKRRTQTVERRTALIVTLPPVYAARSAFCALRSTFIGLPWQRVDAEALLDDREIALVPATDGACTDAKRYLEHWDQVALA
jgi:hypothetical protein